jgi:hypothetical protein
MFKSETPSNFVLFLENFRKRYGKEIKNTTKQLPGTLVTIRAEQLHLY